MLVTLVNFLKKTYVLDKKNIYYFRNLFYNFFMNLEIEPVHVGEEEDVDVGSVENFEHEEIDYAIFRLESGFFATQGHCYC